MQEIAVYEANQLYGEMGKFRFLQFSDEAIQGAVDLRNPERIVLEYPRAMIHLMEHHRPGFQRLFMIGHGVGTIAAHYPDKQVTVAEIDEAVVALSRTYFNYSQDNVLIGDGRQLLAEQANDALDYIIVDAFTKEGTPGHLNTVEFFKLAKDKLAGAGIILMNLAGKAQGDKRIEAIHASLAHLFPHTKVFILPAKDREEQRNMLLTGSGEPITYDPQAMAGFTEIALEPGYVMRDKNTLLSSRS
nr:fused MFS/spermidine synthase [Paenibacillus phyllosphaerae]